MMLLTDPKAARRLFEPIRDGILRSAFECGFGAVWADDDRSPASAAAVVGDYCFLGGKPDLLIASCVPADRPMTVIASDEWYNILREIFHRNAEASVRYQTKKISWFNIKKLLRIVRHLDEKFSVCLLGREEFGELKDGEWSSAVLSAYFDFDTFAENSFGFVIKTNGETVSAAAGYAPCVGGNSLFAATKPELRGQGLATSASAMFISECCRRGIYPYFTAEDKISLEMSKTLGYIFRTGQICYRTSPLAEKTDV